MRKAIIVCIKKALSRVGIVLTVAVMTAIGQTNSVASVKIGNLTWTKQNINVEMPDSWCYEDNESNCAKYGRLYTWEAAKKACASMGGKWRLPTNEDWNSLMKAVGGVRIVEKRDAFNVVVYENADKKLKSKSGWNIYSGKSGDGTDDYGFSALPGGYRDPSVRFFDVGDYGAWWSATELESGIAYSWAMFSGGDKVQESFDDEQRGHSVRCVKN